MKRGLWGLALFLPIFLFTLSPAVSHAQSVSDLQAEIAALLSQVQLLEAQLNQLQSASSSVASVSATSTASVATSTPAQTSTPPPAQVHSNAQASASLTLTVDGYNPAAPVSIAYTANTALQGTYLVVYGTFTSMPTVTIDGTTVTPSYTGTTQITLGLGSVPAGTHTLVVTTTSGTGSESFKVTSGGRTETSVVVSHAENTAAATTSLSSEVGATITLAPNAGNSLSFSLQAGASSNQSFTVTSPYISGFDLGTCGSNVPWLTFPQESGNAADFELDPSDTSANIAFNVSAANLTAGTYSGSLDCSGPLPPSPTSSGTLFGGYTIPMTLTVTGSIPPVTVSPTSISFSGTASSTSLSSSVVSINAPAGLDWDAQLTEYNGDNVQYGDWLSITDHGGYAKSGSGNGSASVFANPFDLSAGTYNGLLAITCPQSSGCPVAGGGSAPVIGVPITFTVSGPASSASSGATHTISSIEGYNPSLSGSAEYTPGSVVQNTYLIIYGTFSSTPLVSIDGTTITPSSAGTSQIDVPIGSAAAGTQSIVPSSQPYTVIVTTNAGTGSATFNVVQNANAPVGPQTTQQFALPNLLIQGYNAALPASTAYTYNTAVQNTSIVIYDSFPPKPAPSVTINGIAVVPSYIGAYENAQSNSQINVSINASNTFLGQNLVTVTTASGTELGSFDVTPGAGMSTSTTNSTQPKQSTTSTLSFSLSGYNPAAPAATAYTANTAVQGTYLVLYGTFVSTPAITIGGTAVTPSYTGTTQINIPLGSLPAGTYTLVVTTTSGTGSTTFKVTAPASQTVVQSQAVRANTNTTSTAAVTPTATTTPTSTPITVPTSTPATQPTVTYAWACSGQTAVCQGSNGASASPASCANQTQPVCGTAAASNGAQSGYAWSCHTSATGGHSDVCLYNGGSNGIYYSAAQCGPDPATECPPSYAWGCDSANNVICQATYAGGGGVQTVSDSSCSGTKPQAVGLCIDPTTVPGYVEPTQWVCSGATPLCEAANGNVFDAIVCAGQTVPTCVAPPPTPALPGYAWSCYHNTVTGGTSDVCLYENQPGIYYSSAQCGTDPRTECN